MLQSISRSKSNPSNPPEFTTKQDHSGPFQSNEEPHYLVASTLTLSSENNPTMQRVNNPSFSTIGSSEQWISVMQRHRGVYRVLSCLDLGAAKTNQFTLNEFLTRIVFFHPLHKESSRRDMQSRSAASTRLCRRRRQVRRKEVIFLIQFLSRKAEMSKEKQLNAHKVRGIFESKFASRHSTSARNNFCLALPT